MILVCLTDSLSTTKKESLPADISEIFLNETVVETLLLCDIFMIMTYTEALVVIYKDWLAH